MSEAGGDPSRRRLPAIKDLADTAGIPTTPALRATPPASGGLLALAKNNTLEFASDPTHPERLRSATTNRATPGSPRREANSAQPLARHGAGSAGAPVVKEWRLSVVVDEADDPTWLVLAAEGRQVEVVVSIEVQIEPAS